MQINCDFISRITSSEFYKVPSKKTDVDDDTFCRIISFNNNIHFLDISRCYRLTSTAITENLHRCKCIQYLDLSYTSITSIETLSESCPYLLSLLVSGCKIDDYRPLNRLIELELLNLRHSTIVNTEYLSDLVKLRSLDLGHTKIESIQSLLSLTRLEELVLDGCFNLNEDENSCSSRNSDHSNSSGGSSIRMNISSTIFTLRSLSSLVILNIIDTPLMMIDNKSIRHNSTTSVFMESKSRREQFLDAVIANDVTTVHFLLTSGENINTKISHWAESCLLYAWKRQGIVDDIKTPFFNCCHSDPSLRPSWLHIAIYFNALKVIELLIDQNVSITYENVWFGSVEDMNGRFLPTHHSSRTSSTLVSSSSGYSRQASLLHQNIYTVQELIEVIFKQGIHRIVLDMKDTNLHWRQECSRIRGKLLQTILPRSYGDQNTMIESIDLSIIRDVKVESEIAYLKRTASHHGSANRSQIIPITNSAKESSRDLSKDLSKDLGITKTSSSSSLSLPGEESKEIKHISNQRFGMSILPIEPRLFPWRNHSMYRKLNGESLTTTNTNTRTRTNHSIKDNDVRYLGKKQNKLEVVVGYVDLEYDNINRNERNNKKVEKEGISQIVKPTILNRKKAFLDEVEKRKNNAFLLHSKLNVKIENESNKIVLSQSPKIKKILSPSFKISENTNMSTDMKNKAIITKDNSSNSNLDDHDDMGYMSP